MPHGKETTHELLFSEVNNRMQEAMTLGDYEEVRRLTRIAEELATLKKKEEEIEQSRAKLASMLLRKLPIENNIYNEGVSARERGSKVRNHFVEDILPQQKIYLERLTGKKYRTSKGLVVGITYAKELEIRPSFWFLGLSDEDYDCVVLLCESSEKKGSEIGILVLPPEFVKQVWANLSRSNGQVKFHIARTGYMNFDLSLPGSQRINISQYLNAVEVLK